MKVVIINTITTTVNEYRLVNQPLLKEEFSAWFLLTAVLDFNPSRYSIQTPDFIILSSSLVTLPVLFTKASGSISSAQLLISVAIEYHFLLQLIKY